MTNRLKIVRGSGNVFRDLGFSAEEAENLKLRAELMMRIEDYCRRSGKTQSEIAKRLGTTQPRLNALLRGRDSRINPGANSKALVVAAQTDARTRPELRIIDNMSILLPSAPLTGGDRSEFSRKLKLLGNQFQAAKQGKFSRPLVDAGAVFVQQLTRCRGPDGKPIHAPAVLIRRSPFRLQVARAASVAACAGPTDPGVRGCGG